jgi:hypothetical protein
MPVFGRGPFCHVIDSFHGDDDFCETFTTGENGWHYLVFFITYLFYDVTELYKFITLVLVFSRYRNHTKH